MAASELDFVEVGQKYSFAKTVGETDVTLFAGITDDFSDTHDALTRLQVRYDLEQLWMSDRPTVLFITHGVEEAVGPSDRVLVMSPSPGQVVEELHIAIPRPRPLTLGEDHALEEYSQRIYAHFARLGVIHRDPVRPAAGTSQPHA